MPQRITVCRKEYFNAAHRIFNPKWSEKKNLDVFGPCSYKNYHGHNYTLIVKVTGEVQTDTGYVYDMKKLSTLIRTHITEPLDHRNLNTDIPALKNISPTSENLVKYIYDTLSKHISSPYQLHIILYETPHNYVEYPPIGNC